MAAPLTGSRGRTGGRIDPLGIVLAVLVSVTVLFLPFTNLRANRIAQGQGLPLWESLPAAIGAATVLAFGLAAIFSLLHGRARLRLAAGIAALAALALTIGLAGWFLTPAGDRLVRIAPGSGFWMLLLAFALMVTDALTRLRPSPAQRLGLLAAALVVLAGILASGLWDGLSVLKEFQVRAESFWLEARQHMWLTLGSMAAAVVAGIPLGLLCHRSSALRTPVLNALNIIQTIPSIALFGLLIGPLAWLSATFPWAASLGIHGIGTAPAFIALFLYSLLPMVANTIAGLGAVPATVRDAARGMGMTGGQLLLRVEIPLAFPVLLTGIRIVLVQNIGLATIAALIGGGGFGVFVFQGIGQMALDLVLLGAIPTVILAFVATVTLDALAERASIAGGAQA